MMENKERKFTELFHHFKADTADIHPDVRRYNEDGVIAFGGELSYEPYDDNITVRVLFLKGISVRMALKAIEEIRSYIIDRPQDYFEK